MYASRYRTLNKPFFFHRFCTNVVRSSEDFPNPRPVLSNRILTRSATERIASVLNHYAAGNLDQALVCVTEAVEESTTNPDPFFLKGVLLDLQGKEESLEYLDKAIEHDLEHTKAWLFKGHTLYRLGKYSEAVRAYDEAIGQSPELAEAYFGKAKALRRLNRLDEAGRVITIAVEIDPSLPNVTKLQKTVEEELRTEYHEKTQSDHDIDLSPTNPYAHFTKAKAFADKGEIMQALKHVDKAIVGDPLKFSQAYYLKGNLLQEILKFKEALECYNTATEIEPLFIDALRRKSQLLKYFGKTSEALECLNTILVQFPGDVESLVNKGIILEDQNDLEEASRAHLSALSAEPENSAALVRLGRIYQKKNRHLEAMQKFNETIKNLSEISSSDPLSLFIAYNQKALLMSKFPGENWATENSVLETGGHESETKHPNEENEFRDSVQPLSEDEISEIESLFCRAIALRPNNPETFYNFGVFLNDLERLDEALEKFDHVLTLSNTETFRQFIPLSHLYRAIIFKKQKKRSRANTALKKAKENSPASTHQMLDEMLFQGKAKGNQIQEP
eukprot:TRINITY_DN14760_c0_g2_i2.p1 TRINITY_DN14760_c0_g2~~TRINITY_DN14760_c0_g2_i2.p1  ORF type:complete len:562 (+),score=110.84 TRINITY_DN14760_c0_g2_i2:233-1918(+)